MGISEKVIEKINAMEERADSRKAVWEAIKLAFESEGADGVSNELAQRIADISEKFDALLDSLDQML